jgi:hypothetical protein
LGAELKVSYVSVYIDHDSHDLGGPWTVRLDATGNSTDLENSTDEYLDPYWEVTALEPMKGRSPWTHGPSYRVLESARERIDSDGAVAFQHGPSYSGE